MTFAAPGRGTWFPVDTSTIMGAAMAQMVSVFQRAGAEADRERTKEALAVQKAEGVRLGRPASIPAPLARRIVRMRSARDDVAGDLRPIERRGCLPPLGAASAGDRHRCGLSSHNFAV
jgi:DNA invertase Pin-like site-specific DNA recombinase